MPALMRASEKLLDRDFFWFEDDFTEGLNTVATTGKWKLITIVGTATATVGSQIGGVVTLDPGAVTDTHGGVLAQQHEVFEFSFDKPIIMEAEVQFTEANTDDAIVFVGLVNDAANTTMGDGTTGVAATDAVGFYKVDSATSDPTLWKVYVESGNSVKVDVVLNAANSLDKLPHVAGSSAFQVLKAEVRPITATSADVVFFINGIAVYKAAGIDLSAGSNKQMQFAAVVRNGGGNQQTLKLDRVAVGQKRV